MSSLTAQAKNTCLTHQSSGLLKRARACRFALPFFRLTIFQGCFPPQKMEYYRNRVLLPRYSVRPAPVHLSQVVVANLLET